MRAKRWGVSRGPSKTKYARRQRGRGRMAFYASRPCDVEAALLQLAQEFPSSTVIQLALQWLPIHQGRVQVMHLGHKADPGGRRLPDDLDAAPGCEGHHKDIDSRLGGLGTWYVALGRILQRRLRRILRQRADAQWQALTPEQRAAWDAKAAAENAERRAA